IKIQGMSKSIMDQALAQAREGRLYILDVMDRTLARPRAIISSFAPRIFTIRINKDKIREVIGPGGKMIRSIIERTGCKIEVDGDRIRLSRKAVLREKRIERGEPAPEGASESDAAAASGSGGRRPFGRGGGHGRRHQSSRHR